MKKSVALAFIFALKEEVKPLFQEIVFSQNPVFKKIGLFEGEWKGKSVALCRTGVGMAAAHEGAERLLSYFEPELVVSLGFCGACDPQLRTGDLVIPTEIGARKINNQQEPCFDRFRPAQNLSEALKEKLVRHQIPFFEGPLLTEWTMASQEKKKKFFEEGRMIVDMESAAVAGVLTRQKVPFLSLRVVFDESQETLPFSEPKAGESNPASFIVKNPKMIFQIPRLIRMNQACQEKLHRTSSLL